MNHRQHRALSAQKRNAFNLVRNPVWRCFAKDPLDATKQMKVQLPGVASFDEILHGRGTLQRHAEGKSLGFDGQGAQAVRDLLQIHDSQTLTAGQVAVADAILEVHRRQETGAVTRVGGFAQ